MFKGIEFDNPDAVDFPDYLFGSRKRKKAAAKAVQETTKMLIDSGQQLSDADKQMMLLAADGKISAKDKKIIKGLNRQAGKTDRVTARQDARTERATVRQEEKTARKEINEASQAIVPQPVTGQGQVMPLDPVSQQSGTIPLMSGGGGGGDLGGSFPEMQNWTEPEQQAEQQSLVAGATQTAADTTAKQKNTGTIIAVVVIVAVIIFFYFKARKK